MENLDNPVAPPTDTAVVKLFIANADIIAEAMKTVPEDKHFYVMQGHVEARRLLAEELETARLDRAAYVKEAGDRIVKAAEKTGRALADFLTSAYQKAEAKADK